ncbi:hypothetical protein [Thioclava electrotropha]|uniref:Uncharacterized protein n=1 Tax=Thioclava electrotropha TaxID=1549850 RepID=A0ABX6YUF2_9RHOB|nr:hypothetical protein [Thioclava electrotropha]QPZ90868.1 hypothetical protein AKL02_008070 [Thioclava electrotropha]
MFQTYLHLSSEALPARNELRGPARNDAEGQQRLSAASHPARTPLPQGRERIFTTGRRIFADMPQHGKDASVPFFID